MLKVSNLSLHYGAAQALRSVAFQARAGEVTCVLGRNGVGKTSLLRAITGHRSISAGSMSATTGFTTTVDGRCANATCYPSGDNICYRSGEMLSCAIAADNLS